MAYAFPSHITENKDFLHKLARTRSDKVKNKHINAATTDQILALVEIIKNILKGNFHLPTHRRKKLAKNADYYRSVTKARSEKTARRRLQEGRGPVIAAIIAPLIGAIAQHILDKTLQNKE